MTAIPNTLAAFILLDRSGSMSSKWSDSLGAIDTYVRGLTEDGQGDAQVSLAVFDAHPQKLDFQVLRDKVQAKAFPPIKSTEAQPRGGTPLYDACALLASMAEQHNAPKTVLIIATDGEENSSREANKDTVKAAFDRLRGKGWEVIFLGVDFDNFGDARSVGNAYGQTISMDADNIGATLRSLASKSASYAVGAAPMSFDDEDRKAASKKFVAKPEPDPK